MFGAFAESVTLRRVCDQSPCENIYFSDTAVFEEFPFGSDIPAEYRCGYCVIHRCVFMFEIDDTSVINEA